MSAQPDNTADALVQGCLDRGIDPLDDPATIAALQAEPAALADYARLHERLGALTTTGCTEPVRAEPIRAEPIRASPVRAEPGPAAPLQPSPRRRGRVAGGMVGIGIAAGFAVWLWGAGFFVTAAKAPAKAPAEAPAESPAESPPGRGQLLRVTVTATPARAATSPTTLSWTVHEAFESEAPREHQTSFHRTRIVVTETRSRPL